MKLKKKSTKKGGNDPSQPGLTYQTRDSAYETEITQ